MRSTDLAGSPDSAAPIPALPVCATCAHPRIAHRRRRCRASDGCGSPCGCSRFTEASVDPSGGHQNPDVTEDPPA
ncbi:hypothetical protein E0504_04960 [Parafrankia sp. BMG5.11]|nr:hypothetical protein E0504_04960 [Parafrankia sp. BMG5.11]